jgi:threonine 3-dehydrogenase
VGKNLITGGLGFLGACLAKRLLEDGEKVILFDIVSKSKFIEGIRDKVEMVWGDISSWSQVLDVVKCNDVDCIYHMGAMLTDASEAHPQMAYAVNINGTFHILEAARLFNVGSVVFPSSIGTYGPGVPSVINEDVVQLPTSMYGVTKIAGERLGEYYHSKFGVNFRSVRFPALIGAGRLTGISRYPSLIIQEPALGHTYRAYVDESVRLPLLYVKDAAQALVSLKRADEVVLKRRVYNLGGFSPTAGEEADIVKKYLPQAQIEFCPDEAAVRIINDMPDEVDDTRARHEWGFHLKYSLDEAIQDMISEVKANC